MVSTVNTKLTEEQLALLPTEDDIAFYEEHGWYISKKVLSDEIIEEAIRGSERFYNGERDRTLPVDTGFTNWKPEDGYDVVRNNEFVSLQNRELKNLVMQPIIGAIAARLARTKVIRLLDDQLVYKPPQNPDGKSAVGWHADKAYWSTCTSHNLLTTWIPFHNCDESIGPLVVLDGSHKWSGIQDTRFFNNHNLDDMEQNFRGEGRKTVRVPMTLEKGQISFHHCWTIHGSLPNYSNSRRLALAIHLQDEENRYQEFWSKQGKKVQIADELMCRKLPNGNPDFSDPDVFPILWSAR
ncbi:phytanoyl-CoA dioxygenase family protein [Brunnivagina elsteri]|uniref:Phytanoyl-CoA dioxygenase n=1 Tax=Brunnivagina elsteri CCALA 953 TaxID=987040 RepID=A0A2A2TNL7_9CYAN|nr:phytanoyl-CoA dioxygenase family protein [Calothrix elsteri]PAX60015.1 phytanoyl-CoA dioxygenase [Calothrix elsteri CCALA 953]